MKTVNNVTMQQQQKISRLGFITASEIWKILKPKGLGDTGMTYLNEKIAEIITGERKPEVNSPSLSWGNQFEADAIETYRRMGHEVTYYGKDNPVFFEYSPISGGSPDGLGEGYVLEAKCPYNSSNHVAALMTDSLKEFNYEYYCQLQFNMMCCKRDKGVLISYDPRAIEHKHRLAIMHVEADEDLRTLIKDRLLQAANIINNVLNNLP